MKGEFSQYQTISDLIYLKVLVEMLVEFAYFENKSVGKCLRVSLGVKSQLTPSQFSLNNHMDANKKEVNNNYSNRILFIKIFFMKHFIGFLFRKLIPLLVLEGYHKISVLKYIILNRWCVKKK